MKIEALVYAADIVGLAHHRMKQVAVKYFGSSSPITDEDRASLFLDAWASVDQIHTVRQVLEVFGTPGPIQSAFIKDYVMATHMRNRMDHLVSIMEGMVNGKGWRPPVYGALSYFEIAPHMITRQGEMDVVTEVEMVTVIAGYPISGGVKMSTPPLLGPFSPPICGFSLCAFEWTLAIERAALDLQRIMTKLSEALATEILAKLAAEAARMNVPIAKLMEEPALARMAARVTLDFKDTSPSRVDL